MKTIVFALQVFGIIALLPVCAVLEMNHAAGSAHLSDNKISAIQKMDNAAVELNSSITSYPFAVLALKLGDVKTKKKKGSICCSCKNCACGNNCKCADL